MIQFFTEKRGSVSVFLTIILVPVIVVTSLFVDASRLKLTRGMVSSAGDLTLNTVLTQYDPVLNDYYGLLASCQDVDEFLETADDYFMACITSQGVEAEDARQYADQVSGLLTGSGGEIVDLLQVATTEGGDYKVEEMANGDLTNPALMKKEIVEFMKYRAPINAVADIYEKFKNASKDLQGAEDNADLVEKKQDYYETEGEVVKLALEAYQKLEQYKELNISEESVNELKNTVNNLESDYKKLHIKMVKDLYNTQGLEIFNAGTIQLNYKVSEKDVKVKQVNSYINNLSQSIVDFKAAANKLQQQYNVMPKYEPGRVYDIQYWVACDEVLQGGNAYSKYKTTANSLIKNMKKLDKVMELLEEGQESEMYTLAYREGVNASGEDTRENHYKNLKTQYETLKTDYLANTYSAYNQISENLSSISSAHINDINTGSTDAKIKEIHNVLQGHYDAYDKAEDYLTDAVKKLKDLKKKVGDYNKKMNAWSNSANSYDTELAENDREEIKKLDDDVRKNVTEKNVQDLIDRLNNIKSLLGSLKKGINDYKYNGYSVRKIDGYSKFKSKSGVNKDKISYYTSELKIYAEESFKFTSSEVLQKTGITDKNHPSIHSVNTPELYKWMTKEFEDYSENEYEEGEDLYKKYKEEELDTEKTKFEYSGSSNELSTTADRPSQGNGGVEGGDISKDLSKAAGFVSGLFSNFSETIGGAAVDARDSLYSLSYIMSMFSYDTYEYEGKYKLLDGKVTLSNCTSKYKSVDAKWKNTELKYRDNKSLTNKMVNSSNNYSYGNEVEYILYGKTNKENKDAAYGTIFAIRYVLDLMPMSLRYFGGECKLEGDYKLMNETAKGISIATHGIIPAPLVKVVIILGLTAMEAANDIKCLSKGMPIILLKDAEDIVYRFGTKSQESEDKMVDPSGFFYSDYLKLVLILKLNSSAQAGIYARTADVIQANMDKQITPGFRMSKANVYYKATATVQIKPLMLSLPIVVNSGYSTPENGSWNQIKYEAVRGY